ncbi:hypothetical protein [Nonomuraea sp. NPDC002799]
MTDHYVIRIYESELEVICDETFDHQKIETGGSLYGLFSHGGSATIFLATRPAGDFVRHEAQLELDPKVARVVESSVWETFGLQGLGMWHSHHWFNLFVPSAGDRDRAQRLAAKAERERHVEILANFVNEDGAPQEHRSKLWNWNNSSKETLVRLTPFFYPNALAGDWAATSFAVISGESPVRRESGRLKLPSDIGSDTLRDARSRNRAQYQLSTSTALPRAEAARPEAAAARAVERPAAGQAPPEPIEAGSSTAAPTESAARTEEPRAEPIPDPAVFLDAHVNPLLQKSGYAAELHPQGDSMMSIVVHSHRRRALFLFTLGWDGRYPYVRDARVTAGQQRLDWSPSIPADRYRLEEAFVWGIQILHGH